MGLESSWVHRKYCEGLGLVAAHDPDVVDACMTHLRSSFSMSSIASFTEESHTFPAEMSSFTESRVCKNLACDAEAKNVCSYLLGGIALFDVCVYNIPDIGRGTKE